MQTTDDTPELDKLVGWCNKEQKFVSFSGKEQAHKSGVGYVCYCGANFSAIEGLQPTTERTFNLKRANENLKKRKVI